MNLVNYLRSAQAELKKVSWPSRKDTVRYSALVVAISVIVAVFFAVLDTGLQAGVTGILARKNSPAVSTPTETPVTPNTNPAIQVTPSDVNAVTPSGEPAKVDVQTVPSKK